MNSRARSTPMLNYIMKWLIFTLMVSGTAKSMLVSLDFTVPYWAILLMTTASYIVLSIYFVNLLSLTTLTIIAVAGIGTYLRYFAAKGQLDTILNLFKWLVDYTLGMTDLEAQYIYPSTWVIVFTLSLIMYLLVIKLEWLIVPSILCIGIVAIEWALGHTYIIPWLWPVALAWVMLLTTKQYKRLSSRYSMPALGIRQASTIPLVVAIVLTSSIILPHDTRHLKWDFLEQTVQDISDRWSEWSSFSTPRQPFRLSQTGFPSSADQLGGPVKISDDVVLRVTATFPLYLRGTILNEYTGSGWQDSIDDKRYKLSDVSWKNEYRQAFDWDEPIWTDLNRELKDRFFIPVKASIIHTGITTSVIFNAQRLEGITVPKRWGGFTPYFNGKGETFTSRDISPSDEYILHVSLPAIEDRVFQNFLMDYVPIIDWHKPISQQSLWEGADRQKLIYIQQHYMSIPDSIPPRVTELAYSITRGIKTPLEKALALQAYLQQNYDYTLQPPYTPPGVDFVDYFLFELKRGYCTYFATAMAVMSRIVGLPTRYVEGFKMPSHPYRENTYEVKKLNGHAWVEIYFPKVGWLTFDPTPQAQGQQNLVEQGSELYPGYYGDEYYPWMQDEQMKDYQPEVSVDTGGFSNSASPNRIPLFVLIILMALILIIAGMAGLKVWDVVRWKKIKKLPSDEQLAYCYQQILWLLTLYGFPMHQGETPYCYARRVDTWLTNSAGSMMEICQLVVKNRFGNQQLSKAEIQKILRFYHNLEDNIKSLLGFYPYIFKLISKQLSSRISRHKNPQH
ncbi:transglutaminase-like putative cysteine protease [Caldicoprobacter guelmensis]|uniref:transglutaminase TgpA family protein n=1 Tax=Caldicoprobacter guelmensis TaxID=1170224 RepID=UPI00195AD3D5|nr:transglutaminaseTgpA domain-containing protein [Caldicoprobacter guelmensis]MBM7582266.1 transglutaminase-like putative cysteine protease [Caldicoprobacter guelmensis]